MVSNQVSIARHSYFYKTFFNNHRDFLEELTKLDYTTLKYGYKKLDVFYSSYSYYLRDDDKDNYLKELLLEKKTILNNDERYNEIVTKINMGGIGVLTYEELQELNIKYNKYLKEMLEIFETFVNKFAPNDLFPKITTNLEKSDLEVIFVVYDTFYESLYNLHGKILSELLDFNVAEFTKMFQQLMVFFYGYSYYLQKNTQKEVRDLFDNLYEFYNNKEFLQVYYNLIQGSVSKDGLDILNKYKENMFNGCIEINEKINGDLPKSNLFPKRATKVTNDLTLI